MVVIRGNLICCAEVGHVAIFPRMFVLMSADPAVLSHGDTVGGGGGPRLVQDSRRSALLLDPTCSSCSDNALASVAAVRGL